MSPFWKTFVVICIVAAGGLYWWKLQSDAGTSASSGKALKADAKGKGAGRRARGPVAVKTIVVSARAMPVVVDAVGTVEPEHSVAVRPQVNGVLEAVLFKEGDSVRKGQPLFRIDSRPMRAAVAQATAAVARDEAQLAQAKAQEARLRPLIEKDYITRQEYDVAMTQAKSLEATVTANRAALEQARLQLSYASIEAPIAGRTGDLSVKSGNLVSAGAAGAPLVVINSTKPILVTLSVPQRYLDEIRHAWSASQLKVAVSADRGGPAVAEGTLIFMDNEVNTQTGTIQVKARVNNEKEQLWPGQFVAGRIILRTESHAIPLPESAVQPGQDRPFVYVVREGKASMHAVEISRQVGDQIVISKGLSGGEQVIVDVPYSLTDGMQVQVRNGGTSEADAAAGSDNAQDGGKSAERPRT